MGFPRSSDSTKPSTVHVELSLIESNIHCSLVGGYSCATFKRIAARTVCCQQGPSPSSRRLATYPPWVVELEARGSHGLVGLASHEAGQAAVALHHCCVVSMLHEVIVIVEVEVRYFAARWLAELWCIGRTTHPVPSINSAPGLLSAVLHLLELADRHGAESEELRWALARAPGRQGGRAAYASHDGIGQQSLERDTHDCESVGGCCGVEWVVGVRWYSST